MSSFIYAFVKSAKVWWICGIVYTIVVAGYNAYIKDYGEFSRAIVNGFMSVLGLIIVCDMEKRYK